MIRFSHHRTGKESLQEYGRGIAGGLMFSIPLLYTMEVWWAGVMLHPLRILFYVFVTFGLLLIYNRFAGLRQDATLLEVVIDSIEELGIGLILAATVLWLTGRLGPDMSPLEIVGMIVMEAMTVAIGVSVGTAQLGAKADRDEGLSSDDPSHASSYIPQAALALCGAVLFAANVAPTDEISLIAMEISPARLLGISLFSILLSSLILHFSEFRGAEQWVARESRIQMARGISVTYAVSLIASAGCLWFFGKLDNEPISQIFAQVIVLSFPAVLGASAGRLMLQSDHNSESNKI